MVRMLTHGKYLLDTSTCIALIKEKPSVVNHIRQVGVDDCKISNITLAELYFGAYKSGRKEHFEDVIVFSNLFEQYDVSCLKKYGEIRWLLESKGIKIGDMDTFIAATALEEDLILVTGNIKHFDRVPGLKVENWMVEG